MKASWLWENFWAQGKKARDATLQFRFPELIEKLDEDYNLYLEARKKGKEIFGWGSLSRKELAAIREDIGLLKLKIESLFKHSHIRKECQKAWGSLWSQKVWAIKGFLSALHQEVNREMLLLHNNLENLKHLRDTEWNPRRRRLAEEKIQRLQCR